MIKDFITLIKFLNGKRKEGNDKDIKEESKIYEVIDKLNGRISDYFIKIFEHNDDLTIDKTTAIFEYYLKAIYEVVNNEMEIYNQELNEESKNIINDYYQKSKSHLISKKDFARAIRLFETLVIFLEEDKGNKLKNNRNNIVNYLKAPDLWNKEIYEDQNFNKNLNELKSINAPINQIISLYECLGKDIEDNYFEDIKKEIKNDNIKKETNTTKLEIEEPKEVIVNKNDPFVKHEEEEVEDKEEGGDKGEGEEEEDPFAPKENNENEDARDD
jgi:hypothetical protein